MSGERGQPWIWGETEYLGTAQEEFNIATGYWQKWQRCEEEKAELVEAAKDVLQFASFTTQGRAARRHLKSVIAKAEGQ